MLAISRSAALWGIDAVMVTIEVDVSPGLPAFTLVGLPDSAVKEARERVFSAMRHAGYVIPNKRITINLAPANWRKEGSAFDLPMALALLVASEQESLPELNHCLVAGELALDGSVRATRGAIALALAAREANLKGILLPTAQAIEAAWVGGEAQVFPVLKLADAVFLLKNSLTKPNELAATQPIFMPPRECGLPDFSEIRGQSQVRRALEVAAAGGHNMLMIGSPGCGKSLMAKAMAGILPPLSHEESLEVSRIHSCSGSHNNSQGLIRQRPFRQPHHSVSVQAMVGGGHTPRPGEISLAHRGVLFLDELPEFKRSTLEALRQPLEEGQVQISRAAMTLCFPAQFMLIAAMNPCPCGFMMDARKACTCAPDEIARYRSRISGPLLDRIDLHIEVLPVPVKALQQSSDSESSACIRNRVMAAQVRQQYRFREAPHIHNNAQLNLVERKQFCSIAPSANSLLEKAMNKLGLSARAYDRILKVALTLADLSECDLIGEEHIAEAIHYRCLDRPLD